MVISLIYIGRTCYHNMVILKCSGTLHHHPQVVLDFLPPASRQYRNLPLSITLSLLLTFLCLFTFPFLHSIHTRITHIMHLIITLLKPLHLKRQNREQFIHITPDILDTAFLPCPYLRTDIVIDLAYTSCTNKRRNIEIEAWIIHQNNHIRLPFGYISLALSHVLQYLRQVHQHRNEAHISQFTIMLHKRPSHSSHLVATIEPKLCRIVSPLEFRHQVRGMQVARRLSCYQIISHGCLLIPYYIINVSLLY